MILRRLLQVVVALATLVGPLAAVAHALFTGSVTTVPYVSAPAIGMPLLALLAVALAGGGAYLLRRAGRGAIAKVGFVAALTALAGLAYANGTGLITIAGAQCGMQAVNEFDPSTAHTLVSNCPNPIQIVSIQWNCEDPAGPAPCSEGQVLNNGDSCSLPICKPA